MFSVKRKQPGFQSLRNGITKSTWRKDLNPNLSKITILLLRNKLNLTSSWKKFWKKVISICCNRSWNLHSSLSKRKMANFDPVRITVISMIGPSKMHTCYLLYQNSWTNWKVPNTFQKWMYNGGTTISGLDKGMNGKLHSRQTKDYSNQQ